MKKLFAVFLLMWGAVNGFGQVIEKGEVVTIRMYCGPSRVDPAKSPIAIVNNKYVMYSLQDFTSRVNINDVESLTVVHKNIDSLIELYGERAKYGAVRFNLFDKVNIVDMNGLFDLFNIKNKDQSLPIYVNDKLITDRANFFITSTVINKVKIVNKPTAEVADLKFISIKTKP